MVVIVGNLLHGHEQNSLMHFSFTCSTDMLEKTHLTKCLYDYTSDRSVEHFMVQAYRRKFICFPSLKKP